MIVDNTPGASPLAVRIGVRNSGGTVEATLKIDGDGDFGSAASVRKRQLTAGADASVTLDGVTVTRSGNTIDDILDGVTFDLLKGDPDTTVALNVGRDTDAIGDKGQCLCHELQHRFPPISGHRAPTTKRKRRPGASSSPTGPSRP